MTVLDPVVPDITVPLPDRPATVYHLALIQRELERLHDRVAELELRLNS